jgi:L-lactate dehydrogenase complex protein LldG
MVGGEKSTRENILKRIRKASLVSARNDYSAGKADEEIYATSTEQDLLVRFATELTQIGGSFVYCSDEQELYNELRVLLTARKIDSLFTLDKQLITLFEKGGLKVNSDRDQIGEVPLIITRSEFLVARLGSVLVSSKQMSGRLANYIPDLHIVIAEQNQVVEKVKDAISLLKNKYVSMPSMTTLITGPSRTADIEKTLVMGAHGPRELIVFVLEKLPL